MIHYAVNYYSQAMKRKCWHAESEAGMDFATQERQKYNLWLWQTLENFSQLQVFWFYIPVSFLPHLKEKPITFQIRIFISNISKYPFTRTHSSRSTRTTRHVSAAQLHSGLCHDRSVSEVSGYMLNNVDRITDVYLRHRVHCHCD